VCNSAQRELRSFDYGLSVPSPLSKQIRALETEVDRVKKRLLVCDRREWSTNLAKLQAVYSNLERYYVALAVECYSEGLPPKKANVPDCTDSAA
jgi:hypothetical protein